MSALRRRGVQAFLALVCAALAAFWVWALFFPPKGGVATLEDDSWGRRADEICRQANAERVALSDLRRVSEAGPNALAERADIVDKATDIVAAMVDDVVAVVPSGTDDPRRVDIWEGYYRTLIQNRRDYTAQLRDGHNPPFRETAIESQPISDYINDFVVANRMSACAAPVDLST